MVDALGTPAHKKEAHVTDRRNPWVLRAALGFITVMLALMTLRDWDSHINPWLAAKGLTLPAFNSPKGEPYHDE